MKMQKNQHVLLLFVLSGIVLQAAGFSAYSYSSSLVHNPIRYPLQFPSHSKHLSPDLSNQRALPRLSSASAAVSAAEEGDQENEGLSVPAATFNLIKACVGTGVLTLPWGLAAASDIPAAVLPATVLLILLAALSAYTFFLIGRICHFTGATSLGQAWEKEVGARSAWIVSAACFSCAFGSAISYSIVLGDVFSSLASTAGLKGLLATRQASLLAITLTTLGPLCRLQSLGALAPVSVLGVLGVFVTCGFMGLRSIPGGPYSLPDGSFLASLAPAFRPSFGKVGLSLVLSPSALILGSMAALSFLAHFNAPDFYKSLGKHKKALTRFGRLTTFGFGGVAIINICIMAFGFLTFGGNCSDIILNNYSNLDAGASMCRMLTALSVIGGYPFMLAAMKSAVLQVIHKEEEASGALGKKVTRGLLAFITCIAMVVHDAGFVVGLNGAIMGSAIIYIFPPFLYRKSTARRIEKGIMQKSKRVRLERALSRVLIAFGFAAALAGAAVTVLNSYFPQLVLS